MRVDRRETCAEKKGEIIAGCRIWEKGPGEKETLSEPTLHGGRVSMCAGQWCDGEGVGFTGRKAGHQSGSAAH